MWEYNSVEEINSNSALLHHALKYCHHCLLLGPNTEKISEKN